jgi:carbon-monoxide dehydrogenase medium subunit/xanthine dehydrogenase FAD-binding subunit
MKAFDYVGCASVEDACAVLDARAGSARILAGGTDLLLELRRPETPSPGTIVDIGRISSLRGILGGEREIAIGPLVTHAELSRSPLLRKQAGFLASAAAAVGSPQIRNRGTIGGNIMNAAACADTVPPLVALGARLILRSLRGERVANLDGFFEKPYRTHARDGELLTRISFPAPPEGARTAFVKLGRRNALSIARLSVAALLARDGHGVITEARIVPGAALPVWRRMPEAEAMLIGMKPSVAIFTAAGERVSETMIRETGRRWSTEYKEPVLAVLVRRALEACCADPKE